MSLQVLATDEGIYLARVAMRDPASGQVRIATGNKAMWQGGTEDVEHFASDVAAAVMDSIEWTVA